METGKTRNRNVVLIAGMLILLCVGVLYMWSVFAKELQNTYSKNQISYTASIMFAFFAIGILIGGRIQDKKGPKIVTMIGCTLFSIGVFLTSFILTKNIYLIYFFYGAIGGFGVGFAYTSAISCIQKWFPDKKGFATGMVVCSFGFSLVVFSPVTELLFGQFGIENTFRILAIVFFAICIPACFLLGNPPDGWLPEGFVRKQQNVTQKQYMTSEMLKTKAFYLITLSMMFVTPAYFIMNPIIKILAEQRDISKELSTAALMITGVASASGRLFFPWISDKFGRKTSLYSLIAVTFVSSIALIFAKGYIFMLFLALVAFAFGGSSGVFPALTSDIYGTKNAGANYGCVMVGFGLSAAIFPLIANIINDKFANSAGNTALIPFIIAAIACVFSALVLFFVKKEKEPLAK